MSEHDVSVDPLMKPTMNLGINFMSSGQDPTGEEKETPCFKTDNYAERSRIMKERLTNEE